MRAWPISWPRMNSFAHTVRTSALKFSLEIAFGRPLSRLMSATASARRVRVVVKKSAGQKIVQPSTSVVATSTPLGILSLILTSIVVRQRHGLARPVGEALEGARVPHEFHNVAVLGPDTGVVVDDRHPTVAACHRRAPVLGAGAEREPHDGCGQDDSKDVLSHVGTFAQKCAGDHVPTLRCLMAI